MKLAVIAVAATLALPALAYASLGGNVATVQADQEQMKATVRVARSASNYSVHEIQLGSGTTVREYAARNGIVFGVAWNGPAKPNLQQVLGQYFSALSDPAAIKHSSHAQLHVQQADLVFHSSGHMRAFSGQAYLSSMLPQGVSASDIQ